jgi:DNA-binding MarR family transcriptional regulator
MDLDLDTSFVVEALRWIVHSLRITAHRAEADVGLSGAQLFVLRELSNEPGITIRRLSQRTLTDASSVSVVVAKLVELGLVTRTRDAGDARKSVLAPSAQGRALLRKSPEPYQQRLIAAVQQLPPARRRQLRVGLSAIVSATADASGVAPLFFEEGDKAPKRKKRGAHAA